MSTDGRKINLRQGVPLQHLRDQRHIPGTYRVLLRSDLLQSGLRNAPRQPSRRDDHREEDGPPHIHRFVFES